MDVLFENSYIRSRETAKDLYRYICFKRPFIITFDILLGLSFITNIIIWIGGDTATYGVLVFVPIFYAFQIMQYVRAVKTMVKRDNELANSAAATINTIVTNDTVKYISSYGSVNEIPLNKIKKVIKTKNLFFCVLKPNLFIFFQRIRLQKVPQMNS